LIIGQLYIDVHGLCELKNIKTGGYASMNVSRRGWTMKNAYKCEGKVFDA